MPIMIWWIIRSTRYCSNCITAIATNLLCCTPVNADVSRRTSTVIEAKSNYKACISPSYMSEPQGLIVYKVVRDSHQYDSLSLHNAMFPRREGAKCYAHHSKYAWHMQEAHSMIPMSSIYQLQLQTLLWSASVAWHDKLFIWPSRYPVVSVKLIQAWIFFKTWMSCALWISTMISQLCCETHKHTDIFSIGLTVQIDMLWRSDIIPDHPNYSDGYSDG